MLPMLDQFEDTIKTAEEDGCSKEQVANVVSEAKNRVKQDLKIVNPLTSLLEDVRSAGYSLARFSFTESDDDEVFGRLAENLESARLIARGAGALQSQVDEAESRGWAASRRS